MCINREHRWSLTMKVGNRAQRFVTYASNMSEALRKADGFAHRHWPDEAVTFEIGRMGYSSNEVAEEHGAILI